MIDLALNSIQENQILHVLHSLLVTESDTGNTFEALANFVFLLLAKVYENFSWLFPYIHSFPS